MECKQCQSSRIEKGIRLGMASDHTTFGLKYNKSLFVAVSPTFCDLCLDCGEIQRMYVKGDTDRKWLKK